MNFQAKAMEKMVIIEIIVTFVLSFVTNVDKIYNPHVGGAYITTLFLYRSQKIQKQNRIKGENNIIIHP